MTHLDNYDICYICDVSLGQVAEGQWKWDDELQLEMTSAFFTGVYGMWNIYIIALLCLYAPSHKQWPIEPSGIYINMYFNIFKYNSYILDC